MKNSAKCLALGVLLATSSSFGQGISATLNESDPVVAATIVLSTAYVLERLEALCQRLHPATVPALKTAHDAWMARHDAVYNKAGDIFTSVLSTQQRSQLFADWKSQSDQIEEMLGSATRQESREWCAEAPNTFIQPEMNIVERPQVVATILDYKI